MPNLVILILHGHRTARHLPSFSLRLSQRRARSGTRKSVDGLKSQSTRRKTSTRDVPRSVSPPARFFSLIRIHYPQNLVPGTPLNPLRQDDRIPVLLIQRSLEPCPPSSSTSTSLSANTQGIHGWTLLFPAGWSMPFLPSLIFTGTRFAGQRERTKQFFEAGVPAFPKDYPSIHAYNTFTEEHSEKERRRWERTPPAKKPNYEKLGTRSAWSADWDVVLGLEKPPAKVMGDWGDGLVTTQRGNPPDANTMEVDQPGVALRPWLLRGPKVPTILSNAFITPAQFLGEITKLRAKNHMSPLSASLRADDLMKSALVMVRAKMVRRGTPTDLANIYKMDDVEARKWLKAFSKPDPAECPDSDEPNEQDVSDLMVPCERNAFADLPFSSERSSQRRRIS
jgi:ribonuclease P/MRP protein subunit POP1